MKARNPLAFAAGFVTASLLSVVIFTQRPTVSTVIRGVAPVLEQWTNSFNPILNAGARFPEVIMAQFILETGYGESEVFRTSGNGFGMKHNKRGYSKGSKLGHADYGGDFTKSLADYTAWQSKYLTAYENKKGTKIETNEQYIDFLKNYGYAEDPGYASKLANILGYVQKVRELKEAQ